MSQVLAPPQTLADWSHAFGDIPVSRIITDPAPGTVTREEAQRFADRSDGPPCEWIDGTLVEKPMGARESGLGGYLLTLLNMVVVPRQLGFVTSEAGMFHISDTSFRGPDVAFFSNERMALLPQPIPAIFTVAPDLAIEVLSPSNTRREMARKRTEYFTAGVRLVWLVDPADYTITVWSDLNTSTVLTLTDTLTGGAVLPDFVTTVAALFAVDLRVFGPRGR